MDRHGKSITSQAHGVIRNKKRGRVIANTMKWNGKISGQKAHSHKKGRARA